MPAATIAAAAAPRGLAAAGALARSIRPPATPSCVAPPSASAGPSPMPHRGIASSASLWRAQKQSSANARASSSSSSSSHPTLQASSSPSPSPPKPTPTPTAASSSHSPASSDSTPTANASTEAPDATTMVSRASFTTSTSEVAAEANLRPLPFLSQPVGVREKPKTGARSWMERQADRFDADKRMERRKALVKEVTRGYFHDFHAMRSHGGKTWRAPSTLIKQDRALYFPSIKGVSLLDKSALDTASLLPGKVSCLVFISSQISAEHARSFYAPLLDVYASHPRFQLVQLNSQPNRLKAYLVSFFLASLRKTVPAPLQRTYLLSTQAVDEVERESLRLDNKHVGYTYLVAPDGKVRWAACGFAEEAEQRALVSCTGVLLNRTAATTPTAAANGSTAKSRA